MPNKTNKELGIHKIAADLKPYFKKLEQQETLDLTNIPYKHRAKLSRIAKNTNLIEYTPTIRRKQPIQIISENPRRITVAPTKNP